MKVNRLLVVVFWLVAFRCLAQEHQHDRWNTQPKDIFREYIGFVLSFDSADDDNGDEMADVWGIPEWVSYEIRKVESLGKAPARPDWFTEESLHEAGIAPGDGTYHFSREWRQRHPNSKFLGYDRGHMCMKHHAWRLGAEADRETHILLNACPQRADLNQGIWLDLEEKTDQWADKFGRVWIVCGPVVYGKKPVNWLGQSYLGEMMVAIPDAYVHLHYLLQYLEGHKFVCRTSSSSHTQHHLEADRTSRASERWDRCGGIRFLSLLEP